MNKVILIGNVGTDPNVRYLDSGVCVAQIRLATTERGYKLPNGTEVPARTEWHTLLFFGNMAKTVEHYVHKGDKLYIEGRIRYRMYDTQKGERRYVTEIYVDNMEMLSPKPQSAESDVVSEQAPQPQANDNQMPF